MITAIYIFIVFLAFFAGVFIGAIRLANKLSEATIKAYTDLQQSRKLAEILPLESADAFYPWRELMKDYDSIYVPEKMLMSDIEEDDILAWSLAALRNLLPAGIKISENTYLFESHNTFDKSWVYRYYNEDGTSYLYYNDTSEINACVAMIEKLHELNLL